MDTLFALISFDKKKYFLLLLHLIFTLKCVLLTYNILKLHFVFWKCRGYSRSIKKAIEYIVVSSEMFF